MSTEELIPDLPYTAGEEDGVLGREVNNLPDNPETFQIDTVAQKHPKWYFARFTVPEFTSLCPKTKQPDFATIYIDYVPFRHLIESKSLKLYMFSFRNHGAFHEDVVNIIAKKLWDAAEPQWLRVVGVFNPRGGIPIDVVVHAGKLPTGFEGSQVPPMPLPLYTNVR